MSSSVNPLSSLSTSLGSSSSGSSTSGAGLGQGINVQQFVQFAVANQQANITALQTQQSTLASQTSELSSISTNLNNLNSATSALSDPLGALTSESASSSDNSILSVTASSGAVAGSHTVTVNSLATTSSYYTNEAASSSAAIATGTFQIQVGSQTPVTITVGTGNDTLSQLASTINSQNAGVTASVIQDANGYRLALVSNSSGAAGDIRVSNNTTGLNFTKAETGTNASLVVDGIPVSSASNTVNNVISGVTLNLGAPSAGTPVTVNVSPDTAQATSAINSFVSAYNTVVNNINSQFSVGSEGGGGPLEADNSLRDAQGQLLSAISYSLSGNNGIVNLASIGVNLNDDGTLSVDNGALATALSNNFAAVQNLFQNTTSGFSQNLANAISSLNSPSGGILTTDSQSITSTSQDIGQQISDLQASLTTQEQSLTAVYAQVNATLQELPLLENQLSQQLSGIA